MKKNIENSDMPISSPTMFAPRKRPQAEDRERHQRMALAPLDDQERDQQDDGAGESQQRRRRSPADVDRVHDRVDEQREARGDGHGAGQVERARSVLGAALDQRPRRERRRREPDRDVDEQHPAPAQAAGEDPAEEHAGRAAGARDRAPDTQRAVALGALGERGGDDRQRRRRDDRGARGPALRARRSAIPPTGRSRRRTTRARTAPGRA